MPRKSNKAKKQKKKNNTDVSQKQKQSSVIHINIGDNKPQRRAPTRRAPAKPNPSSGGNYVNPLKPTLLMNTQPSNISGVGELAKLLSALQNNSSINQLGMGRVNPMFSYDSLTEQKLAEQQRIINDSFGANRTQPNRSFLGKVNENQMEQVKTGFEPQFMVSGPTSFYDTDYEEEMKEPVVEPEEQVAEAKAKNDDSDEEEFDDTPLLPKPMTEKEIVEQFNINPESLSINDMMKLSVPNQKRIITNIKQSLAVNNQGIKKGYINAYRAFTGEKTSYRIKKDEFTKKLSNLNL